MAMRRRTVVLPLILALLALGLYYAGHASVEPEALRPALGPQYLGQAAVALPAGFTVQAGRLAVTCPGPSGLTRVTETPHQNYGPVAFEALSIMLPREGASYIARDLSLEMGRPAQLVHTSLGPGVMLSSVIADFGTGSLRLSRTVRAEEAGAADEGFIREARDFMGNYTWGHRGAASGALHSLYGHMGRARPCLEASLNLLFASEDGSIKLLVNNRDDLAVAARDLGLEAAAASPDRPPSWFSEAVKIFQGQWNRKIQGGPRLVAGRPGLEWVAIRRDLASGRVFFTAQWLPDTAPGQGPMPALLMNAALPSAPAALGLWNDILGSSTLAMDFYL